ncbi:Ubiquitin-like domain superfamily [Arabidopsis suecica]|uniref:Ubiquitin-like domain superfamily n=1 Tax=Arabidopsis suecica TaxID=45249 RepID=A0A8T1ZEY5_ARASU|nr:Ubiquitin-like domain superfamily [Arabidopsis suecica]
MMEVTVENQSGSTFSIDVVFRDTLLDIKRKIEKSQRIPVAKQILTFKGKLLQSYLDIFECQVPDNSRIHLSISPDDNPTQNQVPQSPSNPIHEFVNNQDSPEGSKKQHDRPVITKVVPRRIHNEYSSGPAYSLDELLAPRGSSSVTVGSRRNRNQEVQNRVSSSSDSVVEVINIPDSPAKKKTKTNPRKMIVMVQPYGDTMRNLVEVNADDNVEELRKQLVKMKERGEFRLPQERFYFIHNQAVLHEDKSFLTNGVSHGDTIEIFLGYVTYPGPKPTSR